MIEGQTPLLEAVTATAAQIQEREEATAAPLLQQEKLQFPPPHYPRPPMRNAHNIQIPQTIAHRGFKLRYPENTLGAFKGAIEAGSHAIETDLHLSRDGVVVLSHDPSLLRCFGIKKKVIDCDWEYLRTLRTLQEPHDSMPRLYDLLVYLNQPELQDVWILLDIKMDNDPTTIISSIASTIASVPPADGNKPWHTRIVLGCWSARYLPLCSQYLPSYPITLICLDIRYARQFLSAGVPNMSFNVNQKVLMGPLGKGFLDDCRAANRLVYVWTVNEPRLMSWSVRNGVDGVITDNPVLFRQICDQVGQTKDGDGRILVQVEEKVSVGQRVEVMLISVMIVLFGWVWKLRYFPAVERFDVGRVHGT